MRQPSRSLSDWIVTLDCPTDRKDDIGILSSGSVNLVIYDGPSGKIGFSPRLTPEDFKCIFTAAEGWGSLVQQRKESLQTNRIEVRWGKLGTETLLFDVPDGTIIEKADVKLEDQSLECAFSQHGNRVTVTLEDRILLNAKEAIEVTLHLHAPTNINQTP